MYISLLLFTVQDSWFNRINGFDSSQTFSGSSKSNTSHIHKYCGNWLPTMNNIIIIYIKNLIFTNMYVEACFTLYKDIEEDEDKHLFFFYWKGKAALTLIILVYYGYETARQDQSTLKHQYLNPQRISNSRNGIINEHRDWSL